MAKLRRILTVALIVPLLLCMASCARIKQEIKIESVDKMTAVLDIGVEKETAQRLGLDGKMLCDRLSSSEIQDGELKSDSYEEGEYIGCRTTASGSIDGSDVISFDETTKEWTFQTKSSDSDSTTYGASSINEMEVKVTFPGKVLSASGSGKISGNTVTWTDPNDLFSEEGLKATASNTPDLLWLWIVLGVVVLAGAGVAVFFVMKKSNKQGPGQPMPGQGGPYGQPPFPGQGPGGQFPGQPQPFPGQGQPGQYPGQGGSAQQYPGPSQQYPGQQYPGPSQQYPGPSQQYPGQGGQPGPGQYPGPGQQYPGQRPFPG